MTKPRQFDTVIIGKAKYGLWSLPEDFKPNHAGGNGEPKSWWIYYGESMPGDVVPPADSDCWVPYHKWVNRRCWEVSFKEINTSKIKWDDIHFRNHVTMELKCNGKTVLQENYGNLDYAMAKAKTLMIEISEHSYNFFNPEESNNSKISFHGLPAIVKTGFHPGEIQIWPDPEEGMTVDEWFDEYERRQAPESNDQFKELDDGWNQETRDSGFINWGSALYDGNIKWHRDLRT